MFLLWRFLGFRRLVALWVLRRLWRAFSARRAARTSAD
jgi:hypothetical protein